MENQNRELNSVRKSKEMHMMYFWENYSDA